MNGQSSEKMVRENIIAFFEKRNKAIREKDAEEFVQTHLENISLPPLAKYFSYDEFNSKVLAIEDPTDGEGFLRIVFVREWYQSTQNKNAGLPARFRYSVYGVAKTNLGWRIYEVVFPYEP